MVATRGFIGVAIWFADDSMAVIRGFIGVAIWSTGDSM